jgi:small subunit ribosomal protein S1
MSWTKRVKHPSEVLHKGQEVRARITNIDVSGQRVSLSIKEFLPNEWQDFVDSHNVGDQVEGRVVNVTDFGLFIDIYDGLEGLAHVSEIDTASGKLEDEFSVGDLVRARILRIEEDEKKVGLTMRGVEQPTAAEIAEYEAKEKAAEEESAAKAGAPEDAEGEDAEGEDAEGEDAEGEDAEGGGAERAESGDGEEADEESSTDESSSSSEEASEDGEDDVDDGDADEGRRGEEEE